MLCKVNLHTEVTIFKRYAILKSNDEKNLSRFNKWDKIIQISHK